jgi:hypothetical protein
MTRHDIRAGLYAHLRLFVYEAGDQLTRIEFDQPSLLFGQFNSPEVTVVAQSLNARLTSLIKKAELLATESRAGQGWSLQSSSLGLMMNRRVKSSILTEESYITSVNNGDLSPCSFGQSSVGMTGDWTHRRPIWKALNKHPGEARTAAKVAYGTVKIDDLDIFCREAGPQDATAVLLLHGFPTSTYMVGLAPFRPLQEGINDN